MFGGSSKTVCIADLLWRWAAFNSRELFTKPSSLNISIVVLYLCFSSFKHPSNHNTSPWESGWFRELYSMPEVPKSDWALELSEGLNFWCPCPASDTINQNFCGWVQGICISKISLGDSLKPVCRPNLWFFWIPAEESLEVLVGCVEEVGICVFWWNMIGENSKAEPRLRKIRQPL